MNSLPVEAVPCKLSVTSRYPQTIQVNQGSKFISQDFDLQAYTHGVTFDFSPRGKPTDNAFTEAFNGHFWAELAKHLLIPDSYRRSGKLETWRRYYNEDRPHSRIGNVPSTALLKANGVTSRNWS
jgi:putative transposase